MVGRTWEGDQVCRLFSFPRFCAFVTALFSYNKEECKAVFAKVAAPDYYRLASAKGHPSLLALVFLHF